MQSINIFDENELDFSEFFEKFGFVKGDMLISILSQYIPEASTFIQFYNLTNIHVMIVGTNLSCCKKEYFDYKHTPNMKICDAVRISISVPFIFKQVTYNDMIYTDGCITENFPWNAFDVNNSTKIGINLTSIQDFSDNTFLHYVQSLINILIKSEIYPSPNVLHMNVPYPFIQEYTNEDIIWLYELGENSANTWIKKFK